MSQDDIDMCEYCDSSSNDTSGTTDGGTTEDCFDENGEVISLNDPDYEIVW